MLIAYSVSTVSTYAGVINVTPEEYQKLEQLEEVELGQHLMEKVHEKSDLESCIVECVSHFAPV